MNTNHRLTMPAGLSGPHIRQRMLPWSASALACALLAAAALPVQATGQAPAPVGKVVFVAGTVQAITPQGVARKLSDGEAIAAGEQVVTGSDAYVHLRMVDQAFVAVRPQSRLTVELYDYDADKPSASRIRLNLERGNTRTVSGKGGEAARQSYRFNTPMAAIGLRGTDYTVTAVDEATRVSVTRGAVAVTPLGNGCSADGLGPCAGPSTRELTAGMANAYLEVNALSRTPLLVRPGQEPSAAPSSAPSSAPSPSSSSPPSSSAPGASSGGNAAPASSGAGAGGSTGSGAASQGTASATPTASSGASAPAVGAPGNAVSVAGAGSASASTTTTTASTSSITAVVVADKVVTAVTQQARPVEVITPPVPARPAELYWGRWSTYAQGEGAPPMLSLLGPASEIVVGNSVFGLLRSTSTDASLPTQGAFGFKLANSEAYTVSGGTLTPAQVLKGDLSIDFQQRTFSTSLDVRHSDGVEQLYAVGQLQFQGLFRVDSSRSNMKLDGAVVGKGTEAAYIFEKSLAGGGLLGAVRWLR